ncbi:MAG: hypothetical protein HYR94_19880, partial [Chloroflexi bacterium]|nr:hypothetical protein [Chloroflexota bacterium]
IGPMSAAELRRAMEEPAKRGGWTFEPGLVDFLLEEVGAEPGALPLLSHALLETWQRRRGHTLTFGGYRESGGVRGAIAKTADRVWGQLRPEEQAIARNIFLRLTELGEGMQDTRRRVPRAELEALTTANQRVRSLPVGSSTAEETSSLTLPLIGGGDDSSPSPAAGESRGGGQTPSYIQTEGQSRGSAVSGQLSAVAAVLQTLADARLITTDEAAVEVAHEALIREWPLLRQWLDENREGLYLHRHLTEAAQAWEKLNRDPGELYRGTRLAQASEWAESRAAEMNALEREFLAASQALARQREAEREAQRQREVSLQRSAANRLRYLVGVLAIFLLAAAGLSVYAFNRQAEAVSNLALSESQRLAAEAVAILQGGGDAELAALLSLRALNTAYTIQADMALQQASKGDYGRRLFVGHTGDVGGVAFSPDGQLALSGGLDNTARLWDVETGQLLHILTGHTAFVGEVAFSPDGRVALTGSEDNTARLWDVSTGQELQILTGHTDPVIGVAFSPDGRYAFTGGADDTVRLWDAETGQEVRVLNEAEGLNGIAISPDGRYVLTGNWSTNEVQLWEVATGQEARRLTGPSGGVNSVAFSPDDQYVLAGDGDGAIRVWDLRQANAEPRLLAGHTEWINEVKVSPDGRYALSGSQDNTARLWDLRTGAEARRFVSVRKITSVAFSPDGQMALIGDDNGAIRLWDVQPPRDPRTFSGHTNVVAAAKFSPDGRYLLTGSLDGTARLWDAATGRELHVLTGHTDQVLAAVFSPDGRYALTGSPDKTARLWDMETGQEARAFTHPDAVFGVAFSPDGRYALTGSGDGTARLWDVETGQEARAFTGHTGIVTGVAFSPDGRYILTASGPDSTSRLWDVETGQEVRQFPGYTDFVNGITFSPDGKYILTAAAETSAQLWEVETGRALNHFSGDNGAFSLDGKYILTGGLKTAYLWDRATGRQLRTFGVAQNLWGVAFSPDGQFILIYGSDKVARLWDTNYHVLMDSVCARVLRDFTDDERAEYGINDQQPTCP